MGKVTSHKLGVSRIIVVGGGPAGMMAAIRAAQLEQDVVLIEKNPTLGRKLLISGKGRCNLTNLCELEPFLERFSKQGKFLRKAFLKFFNQELIDFFEKRGLNLKVERQLRVFPTTDTANSVLKVLKKELNISQRIKILYETRVENIAIETQSLSENNKIKGVFIHDDRFLPADKVIMATGGVSYSFTGSNGDGLEIAKRINHVIVKPKPGLVPLETKQKYHKSLEGLTLKNIQLKFVNGKRQIISDVGELLWTSFGISGPLVLTLSGKIVDWLSEGKGVSVEIDLKPGLSREQVDTRLLREFQINPKKEIKGVLGYLLPVRLIDVLLSIANIDAHKQVSQITQKERQDLVKLLKGLQLDILDQDIPIEKAMITRGGISLKDINPATMESRIVKGLYFAGEMIDVDADTGGFNLQAAFSTGYLAGESASIALSMSEF